MVIAVRVLLCVSSVPASCVHIWFVSCPRLMSLWVKYVPAVFVSLCANYPVYLVPVFWVWFRLVYSLLPRCILSLSPALSYLDVSLKTIIWVYVLVCVFLFLPRVCTVTEDQTKTVSGAHSPRFVFRFQKCFALFLYLFVPWQGSRHSSSRHSPLQDGVGVRRDHRECRESSGREPSCPPIAGDIPHRRWLSQARRRVA